MAKMEINILVVEDNLQDFIIIREVLGQIRDFFIQVEHAKSIEEALSLLTSKDKDGFDMVFLDLFLPDSHGQETFKMVQQSLDLPPPVVVLSGLSDKNIAMDIVKQGAQDYLVKGEYDSKLLEKSILYSIERKRFQNKLKLSELKFRSTFESVPVGIGEYDYTNIKQYIQELKDKGTPHPTTVPLVTNDNYWEWRQRMSCISMNEEAFRLFKRQDLKDFKKRVKDIKTIESGKFFNEIVACIWDGLPYLETQVEYDIDESRMESLKRIRFLGDDFGFERMLISTVDVTLLKQTEREVSNQAGVLEAIAKISTKLLKANDVRDLVQSILVDLKEGFDLETACYFNCDTEAGHLELCASETNGGELGCHDFIMISSKFKDQFCTILKKGDPLEINQNTIGSKGMEELENLQVSKNHVTVLVPLLNNGLVESLLVLSKIRERPLNSFKLHALSTMSKNIGSALERFSAQEQLKQMNDNLEKNVQERTSELNEAIKDLESFSYSISHDLKAPLRAVNNFSEILMEDLYEQMDPKSKRYLSNVQRGAQKMSKLIEALLRFSRTGTKKLVVSNLDINEMAQEVYEELSAQVPSRKVHLSAIDLHPCSGDIDLIRQVLINFIWNAIKFTGKEEIAEISITSEQTGDLIEYTVKDNGVGFDMDYAGKVFGVFQRLHSQEDFQGTGVGLAIVQRIVSRHGGKVRARGVINEGAEFIFSLPSVDADITIEPAQINVL